MGFEGWILDRELDSFHQHPWWGRLKSKFGWQVNEEPFENGAIRVYIRKVLRLLTFAYVPYPSIRADNADEYLCKLDDFASTLKAKLPKSCFFIRFDMPMYSSEFVDSTMIAKLLADAMPRRFVKGSNVQPPDTVILDLAQTEEAILQAMKPKWRYNIRLAEKKGVKISESDGSEFNTFWNLYKETSERDHIAIHAKAYYEKFFSEQIAFGEPEVIRKLWIARYNDEPIAAIITLYAGNKATYLYGASSNNNRNVMAPYLLQWHAIRDAKASGCTQYDFYGMSPTDDPTHPMHGLYRFKTGFGGNIRHYMGCIDIPVSVFLYSAFVLMETMRSWWYKSVKKINKKSKKEKNADNDT